ncbi:MAG: ABC transporter permease [Chloroflexota bacterium]|nr:ABC transporter permease [Chloroflexota bacterium]
MSAVMLALRQVRYENRAFWRNPAAAFFTIVFPLMFMVIFNLVFGSQEVTDESGNTYNLSTFYVPAIMVFALVGATYTNISMNIAFTREAGLLKRMRGTPLPSWSYLAGKIMHSVLLAALLVVIVAGSGLVLFGVDLPTNTLPAALLTLAIAAATFCTLGLAVTTFIPNADAAPAIVNASILPLLFISDVFIPLDDAPVWLTTIADVFPVRHMALAMHTSFNPFETGAGLEWGHLAVMAVWLVAGLAFTVRFFRWEPPR